MLAPTNKWMEPNIRGYVTYSRVGNLCWHLPTKFLEPNKRVMSLILDLSFFLTNTVSNTIFVNFIWSFKSTFQRVNKNFVHKLPSSVKGS